MEQPLIDALRFADLSPLIDAERYIDKINAKLGFPLLIGRGCVFDCAYCGGSRHAFRLHSGRCKPVLDSSHPRRPAVAESPNHPPCSISVTKTILP